MHACGKILNIIRQRNYFFDGFYFYFSGKFLAVFQDFNYKVMDLKIINSVTFSPEIAKFLQRRAKQQTMTSLVFRHYLLSFFSQKQNALVSQRTPQFGPSLLVKKQRNLQTNWVSYLVASL